MSNRLEHEFPAVRWRATAPRGIDHEVLRAAIMRGKRLQAAAVSSALRGAIATCARAVGALIGYGAHNIAGRAPQRVGDPSPRLGA